MIRTQIQLEERQAATLRELAAHRDVSMAELIRQAVDAITQQAPGATAEERRRRAIEIAGRFASGRSDVSAEHDAHLAEAFEQ